MSLGGCKNNVNSALKKGLLSLGDGTNQPYTQKFLFPPNCASVDRDFYISLLQPTVYLLCPNHSQLYFIIYNPRVPWGKNIAQQKLTFFPNSILFNSTGNARHFN